MSKIKVPEGMLKAVSDALAEHWKTRILGSGSTVDIALEAALRWLAENPIVPSDAQIDRLLAFAYANETGSLAQTRYELTEWQRRMFCAPEPVDPEVRRYQEQMERLCGDGSFEMKAGFQRGWLAALKTAVPPEPEPRYTECPSCGRTVVFVANMPALEPEVCQCKKPNAMWYMTNPRTCPICKSHPEEPDVPESVLAMARKHIIPDVLPSEIEAFLNEYEASKAQTTVTTGGSIAGHDVLEAVKDLIPTGGQQVGPFYYGITPDEIERTTKVAIEAYRRGLSSK